MAENDTAKEPLVDWTRVLGGALAAVSSALLLSTLGAVGTIVGAALGSVVVSVSTSVYAHGLNRSKRRMAQAQDAALRRVGIAQAELYNARRHPESRETGPELARAKMQLAEARNELESTPEPTSLRHRLGQLPWKRILLVAAPMFLIAIVAITVFELLAGRPVSSFTGGTDTHHGTSFSNIEGGGNSPASPSPSPTGTTPSPSPTEGASPSPSPSPSTTAPSPETPTPSPTAVPTGEPTVSPTAAAPSS